MVGDQAPRLVVGQALFAAIRGLQVCQALTAVDVGITVARDLAQGIGDGQNIALQIPGELGRLAGAIDVLGELAQCVVVQLLGFT